ncbi:MAG: glycosyltransferase family 39 protein [Patescibacteria group bacterium]|jgi:hypothetical protein
MNFLGWIKKYRLPLILLCLGFLFVFIYSWLYLSVNPLFSSPDEAVNYYYTKLFSETGSLQHYEPLNTAADNTITPRNAMAINGNIVPASFLGLILIFGSIAKVFGSNIIIYLTPFFSVLGVLFFYLLLKKIFSNKISFISSLFLFILPPFWYYNSRGMFHNVLFIDLLIIGFYFFLNFISNQNKKIVNYLNAILAGIFLGLALITRTSEIFWVGVIIISLLIINRRKINWGQVLLFFVSAVIVFSPILYFNHQLYGSISNFGYAETLLNENSSAGGSSSVVYSFIKLVFPFGLNFSSSLTTFNNYFIQLLPWLVVLLFISVFWVIKNLLLPKFIKYFPELSEYTKKLPSTVKNYFYVWVWLSVWLLFYYGSFSFNEYIDANKIILGSSYLRYWLPILIFALPLIIMIIERLMQMIRKKIIVKTFTALIICSMVIFSINLVLMDSLQGLFAIKKSMVEAESHRKIILQQTPANSVIISGFADKIIFPERPVIVHLPTDMNQQKKIVDDLSKLTAVYLFYNVLDQKSVDELKTLKSNNYEVIEKYNFQDGEILYQIL